jgi:ABC-type enterochelin transport system substrate-binding protein
MKRMMYYLIITMVVTGMILTACQSSTTKREKAKGKEMPDTVIYIDQDQKLTFKDSVDQFKKQSEKQIRLNKKEIVLFKTEIIDEKEKAKIRDDEKIAELELRNNDLVIRLDNYYDESQEQWDSFKVEYNEDMEDLEDDFKDLIIENKK